MKPEPYDGGPAFPQPLVDNCGRIETSIQHGEGGMTLRDYFAAHVQADDRLVKCIRAMDDTALELFAVSEVEREEWITETGVIEGKTQWLGMSQVQKVEARLRLEAKAIAIVRFMQADAMIEAREQKVEAKPL